MNPAEKEERRKVFEDRVRLFGDPAYTAQWEHLEKKLLRYGGDLVVPMFTPNPNIEILLSRGHKFEYPVQMIEGRASECHGNTAALWQEGIIAGIATGYGLSDDGLWREHTWGILGRSIVETTVPRDIYFGVLLTRNEARTFAAQF